MKWSNRAVEERMKRLIGKYETEISRDSRITEIIKKYAS